MSANGSEHSTAPTMTTQTSHSSSDLREIIEKRFAARRVYKTTEVQDEWMRQRGLTHWDVLEQ